MLHLRYCVYHPSRPIVSWSGHVHHPSNDRIHIIAGLCKECDKMETHTPTDSKCQGCYGRL